MSQVGAVTFLSEVLWEGKSSGLEFLILVPALPLIGSVTLGKLLSIPSSTHGHLLWRPRLSHCGE